MSKEAYALAILAPNWEQHALFLELHFLFAETVLHLL